MLETSTTTSSTELFERIQEIEERVDVLAEVTDQMVLEFSPPVPADEEPLSPPVSLNSFSHGVSSLFPFCDSDDDLALFNNPTVVGSHGFSPFFAALVKTVQILTLFFPVSFNVYCV